jgi:hypothetical protein
MRRTAAILARSPWRRWRACACAGLPGIHINSSNAPEDGAKALNSLCAATVVAY